MDLKHYRSNYVYKRSRLVRNAWVLLGSRIVRHSPSDVTGGSIFNWIRVTLLRAFGAKIGVRVIVKPCKIHFPWNLSVGDDSWIGDECEIYNLEYVNIGSNVCLSQGVYLCTGSHNYKVPTFDLIVRPIFVEDSSWVCARSLVAPGVKIGRGAVVGMGSVVTRDVAPNTLVRGNPASEFRTRA
jgi:putative colanic acid biosynthesis acetyltransferase WcaF